MPNRKRLNSLSLIFISLFTILASIFVIAKALSNPSTASVTQLAISDDFRHMALNSREIRSNVLRCSQNKDPVTGLFECGLDFSLSAKLQKSDLKKLVLTISNPIVRHISVLIHDSSGKLLKQKQLGMLETIQDTNAILNRQSIEFEIGKNQQLHIRATMKSRAKPTVLIDLYSEAQFNNVHQLHLIISGAIIALLVGGAFYNTFIYLVSKYASYTWYLLFYLIAFFYFAAFHGFGYLLWAAEFQVWLSNQILPLSFVLLWVLLQFSINFLNSVSHAPYLTKMHKYFSALVALLFVASFSSFVPEMMAALLITEFVVALYCIALAISAWKNGFYPARWFVLSWSLIISGAVISLFARIGVLPVNDFTFHAFFIGSFAELMVLSVALGDRLKYAEKLSFKYAFTDPRTNQPNLPFFNSRYFSISNSTDDNQQPAFVLLLKLQGIGKLLSYLGPSKVKLLYKSVIKRLELYLSKQDSVVDFTVANRNKNYMVSLPDDVLLIMFKDNVKLEEICADLLSITNAPIELDGIGSRISSKIGIANISFNNNLNSKQQKLETVYEAYRQALVALSSKTENLVNNYSKSQDEKIGYQVSLLNELQKALENKAFKIFIQPQFCNSTGQVVGGEVLVRWRGENGKWISPGEFIPLAEETGNIFPITRVVIEKAFSWYKEHFQEVNNITLSINLSTHDIHNDEFFIFLKKMIQIYAVNPHNFIFEITESAALLNQERFMDGISQLKALGFKLALDDFGTGYSAMNYLQKIDANEIKIDISFVRNVHCSPINQSIVGAIVGIAQTMQAKIVAEGVETNEELEFLSNLGIHLVQGYLLGKPVPAKEFIASFDLPS